MEQYFGGGLLRASRQESRAMSSGRLAILSFPFPNASLETELRNLMPHRFDDLERSQAAELRSQIDLARS
jgi:hypothetical protein